MKKALRCSMIAAILFFGVFASICFSWPVRFTDSDGNKIEIRKKPERVVSLVPGVTEMIFGVGAGDSVVGITWHDTWPPETMDKTVVGGFFSPSADRIEALAPDVVIHAGMHKDLAKRLKLENPILINLETRSVPVVYSHIELIGKIFGKESEAEKLIAKNREEIERIRRKIENIPGTERKRVMRLMGRDMIMTPGDDSFQNEYIRLAGGIPPKLGKNGAAVEMTLEEWKAFNPQVIYGCGGDRTVEKKFFEKDGWKDVDAVKNRRVYHFPCDLTCRASTNAGGFVSWLATSVYPETFLDRKNMLDPDQVSGSEPLRINLSYVKSARITESLIHDFTHRTLIVELDSPMAVISTLEGRRQNIRMVGNSCSSPPTWPLYHRIPLSRSRQGVYDVLGIEKDEASFLFTGADVNRTAVVRKSFRDMSVVALVTAGVESNAMRMSKDEGLYYEPGTVNIILLPNMKLSGRAMARAVIAATEAKTAAMEDLDIRSSYSGAIHAATGTGTDNIIVAEGAGTPIENAGGHTKMGELIARAAYGGVKEALRKNGLSANRNALRKLRERKISFHSILNLENCGCKAEKSDIVAMAEELLLNPKYENFLNMAFAVSDQYEQGIIDDLEAFRSFCDATASEISNGNPLPERSPVTDTDLPEAIRMALDAIVRGSVARSQ